MRINQIKESQIPEILLNFIKNIIRKSTRYVKVGSVLEGNFEDSNNIWQLLLCLKDARYLIGFD